MQQSVLRSVICYTFDRPGISAKNAGAVTEVDEVCLHHRSTPMPDTINLTVGWHQWSALNVCPVLRFGLSDACCHASTPDG